MKNLRIAIVIVCLCYAVSGFAIEKPDLIGGKVLAAGMCKVNKEAGLCYKVVKFSTTWLIMLDEKGERLMWAFKPSAADNPAQENMPEEDMMLVWARDAV